jgi:general secretion pathway protein H
MMVAIAVVGLMLAVSVPLASRFYDSVQYRQAVRDVVTTLNSARHLAISSGQAQDVALDPGNNVMAFRGQRTQLPAAMQLELRTAREVNRDALAVIRFYPEGGSSGGDIDIRDGGGNGVTISVDWLLGRVSQVRHAEG